LEQFELPPDIWWKEYYQPLMKQIETLQRADIKNNNVLADIKAAEREIGEFDRDNPRYGSVFLSRGKHNVLVIKKLCRYPNYCTWVYYRAYETQILSK